MWTGNLEILGETRAESVDELVKLLEIQVKSKHNKLNLADNTEPQALEATHDKVC